MSTIVGLEVCHMLVRSMLAATWDRATRMGVLSASKLLITIVMITISATSAMAEVPREIGYGSRSGMNVTVTSSRGIGTNNAIIVGQHTKKNAREYCVQYALDRSERCADEYMRELKLKTFITADCNKGTFTTFYGQNYMFVGKHSKIDYDVFHVDYDIIDTAINKVLDGSSASGYSVALEQFEVLCPGRAR